MAPEDFSTLLAPSDGMLPLEVFECKYMAEYPSREIRLSEAEAWLPSDGLKFYPDSFLFEGRAGSGVFSEELDFKASFALGMFKPAFQTEVFAILAISNYRLRECMTGKTICICSDSRTALLAFSLHTVSLRLVLQCCNSLQGLSIHNRVQLFLVPSYCGMVGNAEVDCLAGVGSKSNFCGTGTLFARPKVSDDTCDKSGYRQSKVCIKRSCF
jgi:hypothetical protein